MLDRVDLALAVERAVRLGRIGSAETDRWVADRRDRQAHRVFLATLPKVPIAATTA